MEIERKWLIHPSDIPYDLNALKCIHIRQAYVSFSPVVRIRQINDGEKNILTVKRPTIYQGLANEEAEYEADAELAAFLFSCAAGNIITKTRYLNPLPSGLTEEIDLFTGALEGLAYLEIEFPDIELAKSYPSPAWAAADVTDDPRYKNSSLARFGIPESAG
jgi:CYTH domain-containing protein